MKKSKSSPAKAPENKQAEEEVEAAEPGKPNKNMAESERLWNEKEESSFPPEMTRSTQKKVQTDGAPAEPYENFSFQSGGSLKEFANKEFMKELVSPGLIQDSQIYTEIPEEDIMWYVIPREQLPDGGKWLDILEDHGAKIISNFYGICAPAEAENPSNFRLTLPIDIDEPAIHDSVSKLGKRSRRSPFCLHYSEKHGIQFSRVESVSDDDTEVTFVVDHFSWFGLIQSESSVLMMVYDDDFSHFSGMCCKEAYFISDTDEVNILECSDENSLLHNAQVHQARKHRLSENTEDAEIKKQCSRSLEATKYLIRCIHSQYASWQIVPLSFIFGRRGKYQYQFQDQTGRRIHESNAKYNCKLEKVSEDKRICSSEKKEEIETFSLNLITPLFGKKQQYGPYAVRRRRKPHKRSSSVDSISINSASNIPQSPHAAESFTSYCMRVGFEGDCTIEEAKERIVNYIRKKSRLILPSDLEKIVEYLYRKKTYEICTIQELEDYLKPFSNAPKQRFYHGIAFMNSWEEFEGDSSLDEALNQSRMRKIAIVLACHKNRDPMLPAHCVEEQIRIEQTLEQHNGYEIIYVGNRTRDQPQNLLKEHFDEALEIIRDAILHPGDQGPVIGVMVWIKGHGREESRIGMVEDGDDFKEIELVQQMLQTDDDQLVNVTAFRDKLGGFAKLNKETDRSNPPFPIILTKDLCRTHSDGGGRNYDKDLPEDVFEIDAASSGEIAQDKHFGEQWCFKYVRDFKEKPLLHATEEVANIVAKLNKQRPQLKSNLDPQYKCMDGIYVDSLDCFEPGCD